MKKAAMLAVVFFAWLVSRQAQAAVGRVSVEEARAIIDRVNLEFGGWFAPADVLAIIEIESGFDPDAYRYEPAIDDASIGLMQVLFSTAQDRGLGQGPAALYSPETNIRLGMAQLKWSWDYLVARLGTVSEEVWIGSYNAGVGNALKDNWSRSYVARWREARKRYR